MKIFLYIVALFITVILTISTPVSVHADLSDEACKGAKVGVAGAECKGKGLTDGIKNVVNVIIFLVGAAAVIMIIIGGFRYVVSGGDSAGVEGAKNTILYAVIGIIVTLLSYAIVNFVIFSVSNSTGSGSTGSGTPSLNPSTSTPSSGP